MDKSKALKTTMTARIMIIDNYFKILIQREGDDIGLITAKDYRNAIVIEHVGS